jgi:hypothetical protein
MMDGSEVRRLLGQDLPVNLLGLWQPSGLMVLQRQVERLLDGKLRHRAIPSYESTSARGRKIEGLLDRELGHAVTASINRGWILANPTLNRNTGVSPVLEA